MRERERERERDREIERKERDGVALWCFCYADIDECKDEDTCKEGKYCLNLQGSHRCNGE